MDLNDMYGPPALTTELAAFFCLAWPLFAWLFFRRGGRSSAPVTATLIPLAITLTEAWLGIARVIEGRTIPGGVVRWLIEGLMMLLFGALSAGGVAIVALLRRHRPVLDRVSAILIVLWIAVTNVVLFGRYTTVLPFVGAGVAGLIAITAFVWLVVVARGRGTSRPVPFGAPVAAGSMILVLVVVWQRVHDYVQMAR